MRASSYGSGRQARQWHAHYGRVAEHFQRFRRIQQRGAATRTGWSPVSPPAPIARNSAMPRFVPASSWRPASAGRAHTAAAQDAPERTVLKSRIRVSGHERLCRRRRSNRVRLGTVTGTSTAYSRCRVSDSRIRSCASVALPTPRRAAQFRNQLRSHRAIRLSSSFRRARDAAAREPLGAPYEPRGWPGDSGVHDGGSLAGKLSSSASSTRSGGVSSRRGARGTAGTSFPLRGSSSVAGSLSLFSFGVILSSPRTAQRPCALRTPDEVRDRRPTTLVDSN